MAVKEFFWTFSELDEYLKALGDKRKSKTLIKNFNEICKYFEIDDLFRLKKWQYVSVNKNERKGGYIFCKKLKCKIISSLSNFEYDLNYDECNDINNEISKVIGKNFNKILKFIDERDWKGILSQKCFIKSKENCNCELLKQGECVPELLNRLFVMFSDLKKSMVDNGKTIPNLLLIEKYAEIFFNLYPMYKNEKQFKDAINIFYDRNKGHSVNIFISNEALNIDRLHNSTEVLTKKEDLMFTSKREIYNIIKNVFIRHYLYNGDSDQWIDLYNYYECNINNGIYLENICEEYIKKIYGWYCKWREIYLKYQKIRLNESENLELIDTWDIKNLLSEAKQKNQKSKYDKISNEKTYNYGLKIILEQLKKKTINERLDECSKYCNFYINRMSNVLLNIKGKNNQYYGIAEEVRDKLEDGLEDELESKISLEEKSVILNEAFDDLVMLINVEFGDYERCRLKRLNLLDFQNDIENIGSEDDV